MLSRWIAARGGGKRPGKAPGPLQPPAMRIEQHRFRTPADLALTVTPLERVLVIGSCSAESLLVHLPEAAPGCAFDFLMFNYFNELGDQPPAPAAAYDFQVVMLPLCTVMHETGYMRLAYGDAAAIEVFFERAQQILRQLLHAALRWNREHGLLTFVTNFAVPQQHAVGRLLPRYDLRNPAYFVERLNQCIAAELQECRNAWLVDIDQIAATIGKQYVQDDPFSAFSHGTIAGDWDWPYDRDRIEPPPMLSQQLTLHTTLYFDAIWAEIIAMVRTIRQTDAVKLVVIDLDDTLWRGVLAEEGLASPAPIAGWPLGFIEALAFLKKRGVLLAIISKNEEAQVERVWEETVGRHLAIGDFAVRRINWLPKPENMEAVLEAVNLLPESVVYIDDNPVERAAMLAAFPDIRVLGSNPYDLRRILLWAPETQVAAITAESANRTAMVQAQVAREATRQLLPRSEFLASLGVKVNFYRVGGIDDRRFARVLELVNKTNQFNTTGRRWSHAECVAAFACGHDFYAFEVEDRFSHYGLVGVVITAGNLIEQFVMSCRVVGLDVELAALALVEATLRQRGHQQIAARFAPTHSNLLCRDLYQHCGFSAADGGLWLKNGAAALTRPAHVTVLDEGTSQLVRGEDLS